MAEHGFTPGPWRVVGREPTPKNRHLGLWDVEGKSNVANDVTYDDARLIAASPTLLEALEECRECLLALTHICGGNPHCEEVATRARAAITLATGKDA